MNNAIKGNITRSSSILGTIENKNSVVGGIDGKIVNIGTDDYEKLQNLPHINNVLLQGNRNLAETALTNTEIEELINNQI